MIIQATTALRKISALCKKIWGIQGGQGAGKTFSILLILINHARNKPNKQIYVVSSELSKMRDTVIKDFLSIIGLLGIQCELVGMVSGAPKCTFTNGSFIRFIGLDKEDVGKGMRSDVVFVNEANKVKFDTYRELTSRAKRVIIDFNPNSKFWFHTEVQSREDCEFLKLTYKDNEFLSKEEVYEILLYKKKGFKLDDNDDFVLDDSGNRIIINQYWANMWRVYGEGEVGQVEGRIYNWSPISYSDYLKIQKTPYYGCDWGKVDPWGIVEVKYHDGNLYVHELNYASENEIEREMSPEKLRAIRGSEQDMGGGEKTDGLVHWMFKKINIPTNNIIACDSNRPTKIKTLRRLGWDYACSCGRKMGLEERVSVLSDLNIYYTDCSKNIEMEQENYCYAKDKYGAQQEHPVDQDNHLLDAITYITQRLFEEGVIKSL
jgi:phage terminase large subunit